MKSPSEPVLRPESCNSLEAKIEELVRELHHCKDQIHSKLLQSTSGASIATPWAIPDFKSLVGSAIVLVVPFYIIGFAFLYGYFIRFGVRASELNISVYDSLIFSLEALRHMLTLRLLGFAVLAVLLIGYALSMNRLRRLLTGPLGVICFSVAFILLCVGLTHWAGVSGEKLASVDISEDTTRLPLVSVVLSSDTTQKQTPEPLGLAELKFRLLFHGNGKYYLFEARQEPHQTNEEPVIVYEIPDNQVRFARVLTTRTALGNTRAADKK